MRFKQFSMLVLIVSALVMSACGSMAPYSETSDEYYSGSAKSGASEMLMSEMMMEDDGVMSSPRSVSLTGETSSSFEPQSQSQGEENATRLRIYHGYATIEVSDLQQAKSSARQLTNELGGYVEQSYDNRLIVRIPAADFEAGFERLKSLGTLLSQEIRSYDVSEAYYDMNTRLNLAIDTRERLYELLENSSDVEERLEILREIRRLSEEIEQIQSNLQQLEQSISYSRIELTLESALSDRSDMRSSIPFSWLRNLSPGAQNSSGFPTRFAPDLGDNFAVFSNGGSDGYYAESADGVRVYAGSVENRPSGDSLFWRQALVYHVSPLYAETEVVMIGKTLQGARFTSYDLTPYIYEVLLRTDSERIYVFDLYYPNESLYDAKHEELHSRLSLSAEEMP